MSHAGTTRPRSRRVRPPGPATGRGRRRTESPLGRWLARLGVLVICLLWLTPTVGLLVSSLRPREAVQRTGWWTMITTPGEVTLENYQAVLAAGMASAFLNSLVVTIPATVIPIAMAAYAAYAFAWMDFPGREALFLLFVGMLVVPIQVALVPLLRLYADVGISGTFLAVWLAHTGFGMPLAVYIFRNYLGSLPKDIMDAAKVDGASHFTTFWRVAVPLSVPVLAAFAIFQFLWVWNDLLVALIFLGGQPDVEVVTLNLVRQLGSHGQAWHLLTAGAFVTMALPLAVFFTLQRYFVRGLTAGSLKG